MARISKILELERLKKLKDEGVVSDAEYELMKKEIINGANASETDYDHIDDVMQTETPKVEMPQTEYSFSVPPQREPEPIQREVTPLQRDTTPIRREIPPFPGEVTIPPMNGGIDAKKKNATIIGFCVAVGVVVLLFIVFLMMSGGKDKLPSTPPPAVSASETNLVDISPVVLTDSEFMKSISGVWADEAGLVSIIYSDQLFQFWSGQKLVSSLFGEADAKTSSVNIYVLEKTNQKRVIGTLTKEENEDKAVQVLKYIDDKGKTHNLSFVRALTDADLSRFDALTKAAEKATTVTDQEALDFAKKFANDFVSKGVDDASVLKPYYASKAKYYDMKGEVSANAIIQEKETYNNSWLFQSRKLIGGFITTNGSLPGQKQVSFKYQFATENDRREISGEAALTLTLAKVNGQMRVVGETGKTTRSEAKNVDEPTPPANNETEYRPNFDSESN